MTRNRPRRAPPRHRAAHPRASLAILRARSSGRRRRVCRTGPRRRSNAPRHRARGHRRVVGVVGVSNLVKTCSIDSRRRPTPHCSVSWWRRRAPCPSSTASLRRWARPSWRSRREVDGTLQLERTRRGGSRPPTIRPSPSRPACAPDRRIRTRSSRRARADSVGRAHVGRWRSSILQVLNLFGDSKDPTPRPTPTTSRRIGDASSQPTRDPPRRSSIRTRCDPRGASVAPPPLYESQRVGADVRADQPDPSSAA